MLKEHIFKTFDEELKRLDTAILEMGRAAYSQLSAAREVLLQGNENLPQEAAKKYSMVNLLGEEVDAFTIRLLALRQPMAGDLRWIVAALRISVDLERIADYAANVTKRIFELGELPANRASERIRLMIDAVQSMLKGAMEAYEEKNSEKAMDVWLRDSEVDELHHCLLRELRQAMAEDPGQIDMCTHLLFVSKYIERMGDHLVNVAEHVYFMVKGYPLRHD